MCIVEAQQRGVERRSGRSDLLPGLPEDPERLCSGPPPPGRRTQRPTRRLRCYHPYVVCMYASVHIILLSRRASRDFASTLLYSCATSWRRTSCPTAMWSSSSWETTWAAWGVSPPPRDRRGWASTCSTSTPCRGPGWPLSGRPPPRSPPSKRLLRYYDKHNLAYPCLLLLR